MVSLDKDKIDAAVDYILDPDLTQLEAASDYEFSGSTVSLTVSRLVDEGLVEEEGRGDYRLRVTEEEIYSSVLEEKEVPGDLEVDDRSSPTKGMNLNPDAIKFLEGGLHRYEDAEEEDSIDEETLIFLKLVDKGEGYGYIVKEVGDLWDETTEEGLAERDDQRDPGLRVTQEGRKYLEEFRGEEEEEDREEKDGQDDRGGKSSGSGRRSTRSGKGADEDIIELGEKLLSGEDGEEADIVLEQKENTGIESRDLSGS